MKLMKRGNETTHVPDCFISAYKTLGYSVVGEEDPTPTAPPQIEQEQVVEEAPAEVLEETSAEEIQEAPEQVVPDESKDTEFACLCPYFKDRKLCDISATDVIEWQNEIRTLKNKHGKLYSKSSWRSKV